MNLKDDVRRGLTASHYDSLIGELFNSLQESESVVGLGLFGEIANPGISDVDALVVTTPGSERLIHDLCAAWIRRNEVASYLFTHPPLIIGVDLLPAASKLHTLYNVRWHYQRMAFQLDRPSLSQERYLEAVWCTFLLNIVARTLLFKDPSLRSILLVLKNLHQSCMNLGSRLGNDVDYMELSKSLRHDALVNQAGNEHLMRRIGLEFLKAHEIMSKMLDQIFGQFGDYNQPIVPLNRRMLIVPDTQTYIELHSGRAIIRVPSGLAGTLLNLDSRGANDKDREEYLQAFRKVLPRFCSSGLPLSFVTPFGLNVHYAQYIGIRSVRQSVRRLALSGYHRLVGMYLNGRSAESES